MSEKEKNFLMGKKNEKLKKAEIRSKKEEKHQ